MTALNKQALREAAERAASDSWGYDRDEFNDAITPEVVLALLDELEAAEKRVAELESLAAGMEQDPVAYTCSDALDDVYCGSAAMMGPVGAVGEVPLYTAPQLPQPAVPDMAAVGEMPFLGTQENAFVSGWNACRAAMLQGAEPVSQHPELTVWYGSMPESNGKTNWAAILHRKGEGMQDGMTIDRSEYPDRVLYAADRVRHLIGEKADRPCILDYDADAHSGYVKHGNSPATPDGSKEALSEAVAAIYFDDSSDYRSALWSVVRAISPKIAELLESNERAAFDATRLPAAPQQEVK